MSRNRSIVTIAMLTVSVACNLLGQGGEGRGAPTQPGEILTQAGPRLTERPTLPPPETPEGTRPDRPEEAILILEPGPGSRVLSPLHVAGTADPAWEQTLGVSLLVDDGSEIARGVAMIDSEVGSRGPFDAEISFAIDGERGGFLQVFATSARDGGLVHLACVGVTLAAQGPAHIVPSQAHPEDIHIANPRPNQELTTGVAHVEGFALASFEQGLLVEVQDAEGNRLGGQPIIVNAPDWGAPGPFAADVAFAVTAEQPGRIVVRDISPAFGGDVHLASVEVVLKP